MEQILLDAARWYARVQSPECTEADRIACRRWQRACLRHERAFRTVAGLAEEVTLRGAADRRLQAMADEAYAAGTALPVSPAALESLPAQVAMPSAAGWKPQSGRQRRRITPQTGKPWWMTAAAAAVLAAVVAGGWHGFRWMPGAPQALEYSALDERRRVRLDDGSIVHLDVGSELTVRMSSSHRSIRLTRGRAIFDVAPDASRPFSVAAGAGEVVAYGTRFQVQLRPSEVIVTLTEGSVGVFHAAGRGGPNDRLQPGEQASLSDGSPIWEITHSVDMRAVTSWARGRHVFRGLPLAEAVEEINRYARPRVRLGDPELADLRISGNFAAGESRMVVDAFAAALPLRAIDAGSEILLFPIHGAHGATATDERGVQR